MMKKSLTTTRGKTTTRTKNLENYRVKTAKKVLAKIVYLVTNPGLKLGNGGTTVYPTQGAAERSAETGEVVARAEITLLSTVTKTVTPV